jgi:YidC/Oxa1 family membrane protein insertase
MGHIWQTIFYQPLFNLLIALYNFAGGDMGLAIVLLTVLIKLVLYPLSQKTLQSQRALQELQPKVEELKSKYKDQKEKLAQELMGLYQKEKVSPLSSCLPLLVQMPFLFAMYQVFRSGLASQSLDLLYGFVVRPDSLGHMLFNLVDLSQKNIPLAVVTGLAMFWQSKMLITKRPPIPVSGSQDENFTAIMNKQVMYIMPVMTVVLGFTLPGGLMLYWLTNTLLTILQQAVVFRHHAKSNVS